MRVCVSVCVIWCAAEFGRVASSPLHFLKEEMLQEIHKTGRPVWTFTQDAFAKSYISSYDSSSLMFLTETPQNMEG